MTRSEFDILLVEDNPGDALLTREALKDVKVRCQVHHVPNGVEAMAYLRREGSYADRSRPSLVLLDLNMPCKDGREVLAEMKADPRLRRIPVVVLTTSSSADDVQRAYDLNANCYITKPVSLDGYIAGLRAVAEFWLVTVKLPE